MADVKKKIDLKWVVMGFVLGAIAGMMAEAKTGFLTQLLNHVGG